ncbi:peptidase family C50-domain-containing protein [Lipomyces orientalis]|uniref:Peptidase family C50-domain-containing protein n=1 Tax=Lipomyces orientalis TaxID=1233043 RepID=A0ACC3THY6_9ASCO
MAVENELRTVQVQAVSFSQKVQPYGLGIYNRAVHFVTYTRTVMESRNTLPNIDDFLPRVMLDGPMVQSDFERLVVEIDLLRRSAVKILAEKSQDLAFGLLSFILHYKAQTSSSIFRKVATRILENCVAFAKSIVQNIDDSSVIPRLHSCVDVSILLEDGKCGIYIANTFYNYGIGLWRTSCKSDAVLMWRTSIDLQRHFISTEQTSTLLKKLERLAVAHVELKNLQEASAVLNETITIAVKERAEDLTASASIASLSTIVSKFPEIDRLLTMYVNILIQCIDDNKLRLRFDLEVECEGIILEWILRILVAVRKAATHRLIEALVIRLYEIYGEKYPIRYGRAVVSVLPLAAENNNKEQALKTAENVVNRLQAGDYQEDIELASYTEDLRATCSLYISVLEYQLHLQNSVTLNNSVQLWHDLIQTKNLEAVVVDRYALLSNLQMLSDFLELRGDIKSQVLILHCLQKIADGASTQLHLRCSIALAKSYIGLGYSGRVAECLRLSRKLSKSSEVSEDDIMMLYVAEIEYFISIGNLEKAKEKIAIIRKNRDQPEYDLTDDGSKPERHYPFTSNMHILAEIHYTISLLAMEYGCPKEALSYAKTAIKIHNKSIFQRSRRSGGRDRVAAEIDYSVPDVWSSALSLVRSHAQLAAVYDYQGMVRETEFYLTESLKLIQSLRSSYTLLSYYRVLLGDFYCRCGNLTKANELLSTAINDDILDENHMHKTQLEKALSRYYQNRSAEGQEYERYVAAESTLLAALSHSSTTSHSETLEDMLSQLTISTVKKPESTAKTTDDYFPINRLRAAILRLKSRYHVCHEEWGDAESLLQDAALLSAIPRDRALQNMAESHYHFVFATSILQIDPVFTVLQDSAVSIPSVSRSSCKISKDCTPPTTAPGVQTRARKSKTSTSLLSTAQKDLTNVQKILAKARQLVLESYFFASSVCSVHERYAISQHLGQVLLLQSAIGSMKEDPYSPAANYFFELSKGLSLVKDVPAAHEFSFPADEVFDGNVFHSNVLDLNAFQKEYVDVIPCHWAAVSIALCEDSGDLIVSRFQANESPFLLRLPLNRHCSRDADEDSFSFNDALSEIQDIIAKSNETAQASRNIKNGAKTQKQQWWAERRSLDQRLKELLANMEYSWLGGFKGVLSDNGRNRDLLSKFSTSFMTILKKHLPTRRAVRTRQGTRLKGPEVKIDPRVLELFIGLGDPAETDNSEMLEDLIYFVLDILQFHGERNAYDELDMDQIVVDIQEILRTYYESLKDDVDKIDHLVLILDKTVHMFPWESLPCLRGKSISRLPSLSSLRSILQHYRGQRIDVGKGAYILNPSTDLVNTQNLFQTKLDSFDGWTGIVARSPSEEEFRSILNMNDIVLYFGHGGGEQYIRPSQIKGLDKCAATFLLGCSSGALHSSGEFEPWGTPMNYVIAGCPMLVANLWDVTDKDIDKFSDEMFRLWGLYDLASNRMKKKVPSAAYAIGESMAKARDICNLSYLNGAAPVLYGIPLDLVKSTYE